jgi:hypothetical protein
MASSSRTPSARRRAVKPLLVLLIAVAAAVGLVVGVHALWTSAKSHFASDTCTVGSYDLDPDQAAVASTMVGTVSKLRLPDRAAVLALAAGLQESKLTNLAPGEGDRDSVGVLQQRPSQGWGRVAGATGAADTIAARTARLTDVGEATREFLAALVKVDNWQQLPLAEAVQTVQISADGSAYAQHEPEAAALSAALTGKVAAGITCDFDAPTKVASPSVVAAQVATQLGISTPAATGRTVRAPGARWQTASWFVANADRLGIDEVAYAGRTWTRVNAKWGSSSAPSSAVVATMHKA